MTILLATFLPPSRQGIDLGSFVDEDFIDPPKRSLAETIWQDLKDSAGVNLLCYGLAYAARNSNFSPRVPEFVLIAAIAWTILAPIFNELSETLQRFPLPLLFCASILVATALMKLCRIEVLTVQGGSLVAIIFPVVRVMNEFFQE